MCFWVLDNDALKSTAVNGANSIANRWIDREISKPWEYKVNGHLFVAGAASGIPHTTAPEPLNAQVIVTRDYSHVFGMDVGGSEG